MGGAGPLLALGAAWELPGAAAAAPAPPAAASPPGGPGRAPSTAPREGPSRARLAERVLRLTGLGGRARGAARAGGARATGAGRPLFLSREDAAEAGERGGEPSAVPLPVLAAEVLESRRRGRSDFTLPPTPGADALRLRRDAAFALRGVRVRLARVPLAGAEQGPPSPSASAETELVLQPVFLSFAHLRAFTLCLREALGRGLGGSRHVERERRASEVVAGAMEICGLAFGGGGGSEGGEEGAGGRGTVGGGGAGDLSDPEGGDSEHPAEAHEFLREFGDVSGLVSEGAAPGAPGAGAAGVFNQVRRFGGGAACGVIALGCGLSSAAAGAVDRAMLARPMGWRALGVCPPDEWAVEAHGLDDLLAASPGPVQDAGRAVLAALGPAGPLGPPAPASTEQEGGGGGGSGSGSEAASGAAGGASEPGAGRPPRILFRSTQVLQEPLVVSRCRDEAGTEGREGQGDEPAAASSSAPPEEGGDLGAGRRGASGLRGRLSRWVRGRAGLGADGGVTQLPFFVAVSGGVVSLAPAGGFGESGGRLPDPPPDDATDGSDAAPGAVQLVQLAGGRRGPAGPRRTVQAGTVKAFRATLEIDWERALELQGRSSEGGVVALPASNASGPRVIVVGDLAPMVELLAPGVKLQLTDR